MAIIAPEVGAIVEYGLSFHTAPATYRVDAYLCRVTEKPDFGKNFIAEILFDTCREFDGSRMRWCLREEATHVSLSGICGAIAPIEECKVIGMVQWSAKRIAEHRESAERLGKSRAMLD